MVAAAGWASCFGNSVHQDFVLHLLTVVGHRPAGRVGMRALGEGHDRRRGAIFFIVLAYDGEPICLTAVGLRTSRDYWHT